MINIYSTYKECQQLTWQSLPKANSLRLEKLETLKTVFSKSSQRTGEKQTFFNDVHLRQSSWPPAVRRQIQSLL